MTEKTKSKTRQKNKQKKELKILKNLRTLETICIGVAGAGFVGFLSGALYDNATLSLISGGTGLLSAGIAYYANKAQDKYEGYNSQNTNQSDNKYNKQVNDNYNNSR